MGRVKAKLAVATAIVLAGAGGGAYVLWPKSPQPSGCYDTTLSAAGQRELAADARLIELSDDRSSDGTRDVDWRDPVTGRSRQVSYDAAGRVDSVFGQVVRGRFERTTWLEYDGRRALLDRRTVPSALAASDDAVRQSQSYRDQLRLGLAHAVGTETVAGRRLLHIRVVQHVPKLTPRRSPGFPKGIPVASLPAHTLRIDTWLDPATFLPVVTHTDDGSHWAVNRRAWLPRTPANVAKTVVRIPRDFTIVPPGHGGESQLVDMFSGPKPKPRCGQS
jgi:hypothetical protein